MSATGSSAAGGNETGDNETGGKETGDNEELDDPGRDPVGLAVPRNPMSGGFSNASGGPDQDSGRGEPEGSPGIAGQSMMPEAPEETENTRS